MYERIAEFYRHMAGSRCHFVMQAAILNNQICVMFSSGRVSLRLLDLACGTGDVAHLIAEGRQDCEILGCDTSPEMIAETFKLTGSRAVFFRADWKDAAQVFKGRGKFHVISIMGNSLAHWSLDQLRPLFATIARDGLYPGGVFLCDMRKWADEKHRSNDWRDRGECMSSNGRKACYRDRPVNEGDKQHVYYEITELEGPKATIATRLTYHRFEIGQLKQAMWEAGLMVSEYEGLDFGYSYQVLVSRKPNASS